MSSVVNAIKVMKAPFLVLTPTSVLLGYATAVASGSQFDSWLVWLILLGALCAHISVNAFNEHHDFMTGLDSHTVRTPFSGGSGALQAQPDFASAALGIAVVTLTVTAIIGIYFVLSRGLQLLPLGVLGLIIVVAYTPVCCRHSLIALVVAGMGFGPLMVVGTHVVLTGEYSLMVAIVSLVPFFLVNNLLFLNQFPDVEADRNHGRSNLPMAMGRYRSLAVYGLFMVAAFAVIIVAVIAGLLPVASLVALLAMPLGIWALRVALRHCDDIEQLIPGLKLNVLATLVTPVLLSVGILVSV